MVEREISLIGSSLNNFESNGSSRVYAKSEGGVRVEIPAIENKGVEMSASSVDSGGANEVTPPEDDWVVTDIRSTFSKFRASSSLRFFIDVLDILDSSVPDQAFSLQNCSSSNLVFQN